MYISLDQLSPDKVYFTMTQVVIPRPVAWVLTDNGNHTFNLAPYSYFNAICSEPPLILISAGKKPDGSLKDTRLNIEERKHFVVHIVHRELAEPMTLTSRTLPHGESELDWVNLKLAEFTGFSLPRLADCRIAMACELYEIKEVGSLPQSLIFGKVKSVYLDDSVWEEDAHGRLRIHADRVDPIGRLGGSEYVTFGRIISIPRPK
jgi:flavin reductase (DIM6/NTAB) family NADH-FMN oxidoreductase RutF